MTIAAPTSRAIPTIADDVSEIRRSVLRRAWVFCRRQPLGAFGMALVIIMAVAGLCADWIAPYSPTANDFAAMTEPAPISSDETSCRASSLARAQR